MNTDKSGQAYFNDGRILVWVSCGAASAVAAKLVAKKYKGDRVEFIYCDTSADEHEDNKRFLADISEWIGCEIKFLRSDKYRTTDEVFAGERYIAGIGGARCTLELKRVPRIAYQNPEDIHVFGFTMDEQGRIADFEKDNPCLWLDWILRDNQITKRACYKILQSAGIKLPAMYLLGYRNNNCKGCVKSSSPGYWAKVRRDFPETFAARCRVSRELGVRLIKLNGERIFLDELPDLEFKYKGEDLSCGPQCSIPKLEATQQ